MLIIGELRDVRNNKGIRDLTAVSLEILVSGVKHNVSNLVFSLCMLESLDQTQDTTSSLLHCSPYSHFITPPAHTSLLPLLTLHCSPCSHFLLRKPQPEGLSHHYLMQPSDICTFTNTVLYHSWLCSIELKPTVHFPAQWPFKPVLPQGETLLYE